MFAKSGMGSEAQATVDKAILPGQRQEQERVHRNDQIQIHFRQHEVANQRRGVPAHLQKILGKGEQ